MIEQTRSPRSGPLEQIVGLQARNKSQQFAIDSVDVDPIPTDRIAPMAIWWRRNLKHHDAPAVFRTGGNGKFAGEIWPVQNSAESSFTRANTSSRVEICGALRPRADAKTNAEGAVNMQA